MVMAQAVSQLASKTPGIQDTLVLLTNIFYEGISNPDRMQTLDPGSGLNNYLNDFILFKAQANFVAKGDGHQKNLGFLNGANIIFNFYSIKWTYRYNISNGKTTVKRY